MLSEAEVSRVNVMLSEAEASKNSPSMYSRETAPSFQALRQAHGDMTQ